MKKFSPKLKKILLLSFSGVLTFGLATGIVYHRGFSYRYANTSYISKASKGNLSDKQKKALVQDYKNYKYPEFQFVINGQTRNVRHQGDLNCRSVSDARSYAESLGESVSDSQIASYKQYISNKGYKHPQRTLIHMIEDSGYDHVINILAKQVNGGHVNNEGKTNYSKADAQKAMNKYNKDNGTNLTWSAVKNHYWPKWEHDKALGYDDTFSTYIHDAIAGDSKGLTYDGTPAYKWDSFRINDFEKNYNKKNKTSINWSKITIPKEPDNVFEPKNYWIYYHLINYLKENGDCGNTAMANEGDPQKLPVIAKDLNKLHNNLSITSKNSRYALAHYTQPSATGDGVQINNNWKSTSKTKLIKRHKDWMHPSVGGPDAPRVLGTYEDHSSLGLGAGHEYSDYSVLQNSGKYSDIYVQLPNNTPPSGSIKVVYPGQAKIRITKGADKGKIERLTPVMTINNIKYYYPWYGNNDGGGSPRSLNISKDLFKGMKFNGVISMDVSYSFHEYKGSTIPDLSGSYLNIRHLDGLSAYEHQTKGNEYEADNNEKYVQSLWLKSAKDKYGDISNHSPSNWIDAHQFSKYSSIYKGDKRDTNYKHSNKDYFGYPNPVDHYLGYRAVRCSSHYNMTDPTGNTVQYNSNGSATDVNDGEYAMDKDSNIRTYNSTIYKTGNATGGQYNVPVYNDEKNSVLFKLNNTKQSGSNDDDGVSDKNGSVPPNFVVGSGTGYGNMRPYTKISPDANYTAKCEGHAKTPSDVKFDTNLKPGTKVYSYQLEGDPSDNQMKNIVNSKNDVTSDGIKYWEKNVVDPNYSQDCVMPKPTPIQKSVQTDSNSKIPLHTAWINSKNDPKGSYDGGVLAKPNEVYDYVITGKFPHHAKTDTWYQPTKGQRQYGNYEYWDYYDVTDKLPSYVHVLNNGNYNVYVNGNKSNHLTSELNDPSSSDTPQTVNLDLNYSDLDKYSQDSYKIVIPVIADNLPKVQDSANWWNTKDGHWFRYWNGQDGTTNATETLTTGHCYQGEFPELNTVHDNKPSNPVPVEIKRIKASIYDYNYKGNDFKGGNQPFGLDSCGDNDYSKNGAKDDPNGINYKDYRNSDKYHSKDLITGTPINYYGYVGTNFAVKDLRGYQGKHNGTNHTQAWRYRLAYPSIDLSKLPVAKDSPTNTSDNAWTLSSSNFNLKGTKDTINEDMQDGDPSYLADYDNSDRGVPMKFNPDSCGDTAYTKDGFSQSDYMPYIVPHINLIPITDHSRKLSLDKDGQLIVDTDTAKHGLPFRFNMRSSNVLYGNHFWLDFSDDSYYHNHINNHDKLIMTITDNDNNKVLYKGSRPLVSNKNDGIAHKDRKAIGDKDSDTHSVEWPEGTHYWNGYSEADGFNSSNGSSRYNLNTKVLGNVKPGTKIPLKVQFSLSSGSLARVSERPLLSHAYIAAQPKVRRYSTSLNGDNNYQATINGKKQGSSFGTVNDVSDGKNNVTTTKSKDRATFIEPERTIKYLGEHRKDPDASVRELKEMFNITQPQYAYAKTGYGMSANDLGVSYAGHLNTENYTHSGTNMTYAFPTPFKNSDTQVSYSQDNRHKDSTLGSKLFTNHHYYHHKSFKRLGDTLLHVAPSNKSTDGINNEFDGMPDGSKLDDTTGISGNYKAADNYSGFTQFNNAEKLQPGTFATTYGFYPRQATHNTNSEHTNALSRNSENGGDITIASTNKEDKYHKNHCKYYHDPHDASLSTTIGNHTFDIGNYHYGLNGVETKNDTKGMMYTLNPNINIAKDGQDERMFTPLFMPDGIYATNFHRTYRQMNRKHRLGGNFFDIDENQDVKFYGHMLTSKDSKSKSNDEFSLQPILTDVYGGLHQTPYSSPLFPNDWLSAADSKGMGYNWLDSLVSENSTHTKYDTSNKGHHESD